MFRKHSPHEVLVVTMWLVSSAEGGELIHALGVLILLGIVPLPPPPGEPGNQGCHDGGVASTASIYLSTSVTLILAHFINRN